MRGININKSVKYGVSAICLLLLLRWTFSRRLSAPELPPPIGSMEFLADLGGDSMNLRWAHATNSWAKLQLAINDGVRGIEADVILKQEGTADVENIPIMAHPPTLTSDLTLENFLALAVKYNKALIKLDFKSIRPVDLSLQLLMNVVEKVDVPIWLNADILAGPGAETAALPVNGAQFLQKVSERFPVATLSLGWTTDEKSGTNYSWRHIMEMYSMIKTHMKVRQPLTFPINVSLLKGSILPLTWLCEQFDASLTIYQRNTDDVIDLTDLVYLRYKFPKSNIFYDLRDDTLQRFKEVADNHGVFSEDHRQMEKYAVKPHNWILRVTEDKASELLLSSDVVMLRGPEAQLSSVKQAFAQNDVTIAGLVSFVPASATLSSGSVYKANFQVFLMGSDYTTSHPSGIRLSINSLGRMIIATEHVKDQQVYEDFELGKSVESCYRFEIKLVNYEVEFAVQIPKPGACHILEMDAESTNHKVLRHKFSRQGLVSPYHIVLKNCKTDGFAIIEQIRVDVTKHMLSE